MTHIYSITEIATTMVRHYAGLFAFVWVKGEVINRSLSSSGTLYFSLKEDNVLLDCVWFQSKQRDIIYHDILTGEVTENPVQCLSKTMKNGDYVYVAGSVAVYKERSKFQMYVELVQHVGKGEHNQVFEEKKRRLTDKGLFNKSHKKSIVVNPECIFVITSRESAALQDFLHVSSHRGVGSRILLYNTAVQGIKAVEDIINALSIANNTEAKLIVLIRGGGAKDELDIFNDETLIYAMFSSSLPIVTGIGHEIDESLADLVADATGITPTFVAQMLFEDRTYIASRIQQEVASLYKGIFFLLQRESIIVSQKVEQLYEVLLKRIEEMQAQIVSYKKRAYKAVQNIIIMLLNLFFSRKEQYRHLYNQVFLHRKREKIQYLTNHLNIFIDIKQRDSYINYKEYKKKLEEYRFFVIVTYKKERIEYFLQRLYSAVFLHKKMYDTTLARLGAVLSVFSPEHDWNKTHVFIKDLEGRRITSVKNIVTPELLLCFKDGVVSVHVDDIGDIV